MLTSRYCCSSLTQNYFQFPPHETDWLLKAVREAKPKVRTIILGSSQKLVQTEKSCESIKKTQAKRALPFFPKYSSSPSGMLNFLSRTNVEMFQRTLLLWLPPSSLSAGFNEWERGNQVWEETSPTCPWNSCEPGQPATLHLTSLLCLSRNNCFFPICPPPVHLLLSPPTSKRPLFVCFSTLFQPSNKPFT